MPKHSKPTLRVVEGAGTDNVIFVETGSHVGSAGAEDHFAFPNGLGLMDPSLLAHMYQTRGEASATLFRLFQPARRGAPVAAAQTGPRRRLVNRLLRNVRSFAGGKFGPSQD